MAFMPEHTSKQFDTELEAVRSSVLRMGGLVEEQIMRAVESLASGDMNLIESVVDGDKMVNRLEVELDERCSHIIARRQPTAGDLRMLMTVVSTPPAVMNSALPSLELIDHDEMTRAMNPSSGASMR